MDPNNQTPGGVVSFPVPVGVGASVSPAAVGNTATFTIDAGLAVVTFNPADVNNPGTLTLYDQNANSVLTMTAGGYAVFMVPVGGLGYYVNLTQPAKTVALTRPNDLRGINL